MKDFGLVEEHNSVAHRRGRGRMSADYVDNLCLVFIGVASSVKDLSSSRSELENDDEESL